MRHRTLRYLEDLLKERPLPPDQPPTAMPGRKWPTMVAWVMETAKASQTPEEPILQLKDRRQLAYLGKPNRYRALEAWKFLNEALSGDRVLLKMWQAELDGQGLVAYRLFIPGHSEQFFKYSTKAFWAYHPHSSDVDIVGSFIRPFYLKRVGGLRLYSQKQRLTQEAIDAYYEWYQSVFRKKLKRPKAKSEAVIGGQVVGITSQVASEVTAPPGAPPEASLGAEEGPHEGDPL